MKSFHKINNIWVRIKVDYFRKSLVDEYCKLLDLALEKNYRVISHYEAVQLLRGHHKEEGCKILALRHDVDLNNVKANRAFFEAEKKYGAKSSFYFRLSTASAHRGLIRELIDHGFEVGYHFEEGATVAKREKIKNIGDIFKYKKEVQELFINNCNYFRKHFNKDLASVCSHGDWLNNRLKFTNHELIDKEILAKVNIEFEAYDTELLSMFDCYVSDVAPYPERWSKNYSLMQALEEKKNKICMLTHEHNWFPGIIPNTMYSIRRAMDEIVYRYF